MLIYCIYLNQLKTADLNSLKLLQLPLFVLEPLGGIDQHSDPQGGLDLRVEVAEQRRERPGPLDLEVAHQPVPVPVQVAALVLELLVAVSGVELVEDGEVRKNSGFSFRPKVRGSGKPPKRAITENELDELD